MNWFGISQEQDYVHVGDKPEYSCYTKYDMSFIIYNPIRWEKMGRDGSRTRISLLNMVEIGLQGRYEVQQSYNDTYYIYTLSFPQGMYCYIIKRLNAPHGI